MILRCGTALVAGLCLVVASCGGSKDSAASQSYGDFCILAWDLDSQSKGTHGQDPTAMSDPKKMESAWATITASAEKLRDAAPAVVKDDVATLVDSIVKMDAVYAQYKYNLLEMAQVPTVADELNSIANGKDVTAASAKFKTFMKDNCGEQSS